MKTHSLFPCIAMVLATAVSAHAQGQPQAKVVSIRDVRITGGGETPQLEIEVALPPGVAADAKTVTPAVKKAVDDTGRDLVVREKDENTMEPMRNPDEALSNFKLVLKSPERRAAKIAELEGEAAFFVPKADPDAVVKVDNFQKTGGRKLAAPALAAAGIELTAWTKAQADAEQAKGGDGGVFGNMFNTGSGPNDIIVLLKDPKQKLAEIEFQDADGKTITPNGWSSTGDVKEMTKAFSFENPLPENARMVVYLNTDKSVVKVPFTLTNVTLP